MVSGSTFHKVGTELVHLGPYIALLSVGVTSVNKFCDPNGLLHLLHVFSMSLLKRVEQTCSALYVWTRILYCILCCTGSQWSSFRIGVMWLTRCSGDNECCGILYMLQFLYHSAERSSVTNTETWFWSRECGMSFCTLSKADSVEWNFLDADRETSCREFVTRCLSRSASTTFSSIFEMNGRFQTVWNL